MAFNCNLFSEAWQAPIILIVLKEDFNLTKQVFFDLRWDEGTATRKQLLHQVLQVYALEALGSDYFYTRGKYWVKNGLDFESSVAWLDVRNSTGELVDKLTETVSFEVISPTTLNESLPQEFFKSGLLAGLLQFSLDEGLLEHDVRWCRFASAGCWIVLLLGHSMLQSIAASVSIT